MSRLHTSSMESFLASYSLPFEEFRTLVTKQNALVAGSAALALYLQQEGIDPGFEPDDLDIWVEETHDTWFSSGRVHQLANSTTFTLFLVKHGYDLTTKFDSTVNEHYYSTMTHIKHIFHFVNPHGKKVQLICVRDSNLVQYIHDHFDITACISWWNAVNNVFHTVCEGLTCKKEFEILQDCVKEERTLARVEKYKARGFTVREPPCPALELMDPHENMDELDGVTAFDVFAYDDVNAGTYLRQSSHHVLLHIGDQFHAYHRIQLCDYLKAHTREHSDYGKVCELPHKQHIPYSTAPILSYSDYSIISLKQVFGTLYDAEYYTTAQWAAKTPASIYHLLQVDSAIVPFPPPNEQIPIIDEPSALDSLVESLLRNGLIE
jgi:hypothetical protein